MNNRYVELEPPLYQEEEKKEEPQTTSKKFREHAKPTDYYIDGRVGLILEKVERLAIGLRGHQNETWDLVLDRVIKAMKSELPTSGDEDISFEKEPEEGEEAVEEEVKEDSRFDDY